MDPSAKAYLDKLTATMEANIAALTAVTARLNDLIAWRPDLERRVSDLGDAVTALQQARPPPTTDTNGGTPPLHTTAPPPVLPSDNLGLAGGDEDTPQGSKDHGDFNLHRGRPAVSFQTPPPLSANSQIEILSSPFVHASQMLAGLGQAHPSISFPQFTGENPNMWKTMCKQYFSMFGIHRTFWVPMAALNFSGVAAIWLQSVQKNLNSFDWESFSALLTTRFGRDRHQLLIRQFYTIKQTSTVADFIERFELIINHLRSYSDSIHPFYFLTRFVKGLRADIRAVVMVQRPPDLDTACALVLLQEEVADNARVEVQRPMPTRPPDASPRLNVLLPQPLPLARATPPAPTADRRGTDAARADSSKLKALRDYRRARGLCFKCGER